MPCYCLPTIIYYSILYFPELLDKLYKKTSQNIVIAHKSLTETEKYYDLGFKLVDYPLYAPDIVSLDYGLFSKLKKFLKHKRFSIISNIIRDVKK